MTVPLVLIRWVDSRRPVGDWVRLSELPEFAPVACASVGWLVHDGEDCKVLCPNMGDLDQTDVQGSGLIQIPTRCVVAVAPLNDPVLRGLSVRADPVAGSEQTPPGSVSAA